MHSSRPFRRLFGSGPGIFAGRPRSSRRSKRTTPTAACERLEDRTLLSAVGPEELAGVVADQTPQIGISLVVDEDRIPPVDEERIPSQIPTSDAAPPFDLGETFQLHSNPGATKVIYLDFDGHTTTGTVWTNNVNPGSPIDTPAYSFEGDVSPNFTDGELERIQKIWQRVAEDFIPFDVDVTTEDPGTAALQNTGGSDNEWGVRVAIGGSWSDWYGSGAGGVAYVGVFGLDHSNFWDAPAFVFENNLGDGNEKFTTEAISHEVGHTLGLHHDGTSTVGYYEGHGSGATGWAPIMGVGYYRELSQWSRGEYNDANVTEDDLQIITATDNGFGYRTDDHGGSDATASLATWTGETLGAEGIIERNDDVDVFSFTTTGGQLDLDVLPFVSGPNLDILAELYDSAGNLVMASNPLDALHASFNLTLAAGEYFLRIDGTGKGDPLATGYTDYGSLGAYTVIGTVIPLTLSISLTTVSEIDGSSATTGTVTRFGDLSQDLVVQLASSDPSEAAVPATVTILADQASATFNIAAVDDNLLDGTQTVTISALAGGSLMADLTYGTNGVASADLFIQGSVLQSDGKLVVVGYRRDVSSPTFDNDVVVARFNTDGTLDTTFGGDGTGTVVMQAIDGTERIENAITVALQSDGKIIVGGELYSSDNTNDAAGFLVRLDPINGQIDGTFGTDGYTVFDPTNGLEKVWDLLVLPDDTILAAGEYQGTAALYRFDSTGNALAFPSGSTHLFVLSVPSDDPNPAGVGDDATTLVLQPDGKILVGGIVYGDYPNRVWGIARLTTDFQYDNTFGTDGRIIVDLPTTNERLEQLLLQPDGKIIAVGGGGGTYGNELRALARFNADGSLDDTFGEGGIVLTTMDENALGYAAHLLPDGSILVAGSGGAGNRGVVTRYSADGLLIEGATTLLHQYAGRSIVAALGGHVLVAGFGGDVEQFMPYELAVGTNSLNVTDEDTAPQAVADSYTVDKDGTLATSVAPDQSSTRREFIFNVGYDDQWLQQQVTAGLGGVLQSVDLYLWENANYNAVGGSFTFFVNRGAPWQTGSHEFSQVITLTEEMVGGGWITIDVSSAGISLSEGEVFSIGVEGTPGQEYAIIMASDDEQYVGGALWRDGSLISSGTWDLTFRTRISTGSLIPGVLANDSDADGDSLTAELLTGPAHGTLTLDPTGELVYRPDANYVGTDSFTYTIRDGDGLSDTATVSITINPVGEAPLAVDDTATTNEDTSVTINVLANDSDIDGDTLKITSVTQPANGIAQVRDNGTTVWFLPDSNFNGSQTITYTISDGNGGTDTATVSITVAAVNDSPRTTGDSAITDQDAPVTIDVLANDSDYDGDTLTVTSVTDPAGGTATITDGGTTVTFTPDAGFNGVTRFQYTVSDGNSGTRSATVQTTVYAPAGIQGTVWDDVDGDGVRDAGESGLENVTVYLDLNDNGVLDNSSEIRLDPDDFESGTDLSTILPQATLSTIDHNGNIIPAVNALPGPIGGTATNAVIGHFEDTGAEDTIWRLGFRELRIDFHTFVRSVSIDFRGGSGRLEAYDANGRLLTFDEDSVSNLGATGTLTVTTFSTGIAYVIAAGWVSNTSLDNLRFTTDTPEPVATTDANGNYAFTGVVPGEYVVRQITPQGVTQTAPNNTNGYFYGLYDTRLYKIDAVTGDFKLIGPPIQQVAMQGMAYTNAGRLFGLKALGQDPATLYEIDLATGVATSIGPVGRPVRAGLAYDHNTDTLYGVGGHDDGTTGLLIFNTATGAATPFGQGVLGINAMSGMAFDAANNRVIAFDNFDDEFWAFDVATGAATLLGNISPFEGYGFTETETGLVIQQAFGNEGGEDLFTVNPDAGTLTHFLTLEDSFGAFETLEYVAADPFAHHIEVGAGQTATATDFGNLTVNDAPLTNPDNYTVTENGTLSASAPVVDQSNTGTGYVFSAVGPGWLMQQQVTAGTAGMLRSVDLYIYDTSEAGSTFTFVVNRGVPWQTDSHDFSKLITITQGMIGNWITIDVSSAGISLATGEVFTIGTGSSSQGTAYLRGSSQNPYAGGALWINGEIFGTGNYDLAFRTRIANSTPGVLANDSDPEGAPLTAALVSGPAHGTLTFSSDGSFVYTPDADYFGTDSFTYRASDGTTASDPVTVLITITQVNSPPAASPDSYTVNEDGTLQTTSATPALDQQTDTFYNFSAAISGGLQHQQQVTAGTAGLLDSVDFYLANGTVGDTFQFLIHLGPAWQYDNAVYREDVVITAEMVNNWVTIDLQSAGIVLGAGDIFAFSVRASGSGSISLYGSTANPYSGGTSWTGSETSSFEDPDADFAFRTRMVPEPYPSGLLANDSDPDGDPLTAELVTGPAHGALTLNADGSFSYSPDANYAGTDSFTYRASDGFATSNPVTVSIMVEADHATPESLAITYVIPPPYPYLTEATGTTTGTITRTGDLSGDVVIQLTSSNPSKLSVPETVTIAASQASANFTITLIDDNLLSGNEFITLTATSGSAVAGPLTLNESFGTAGLASTPLTFNWQPPYAVVATLPSGKVLAASEDATDGSWRLIRLNADGTLDTTFGNGGSVITAFNGSNGAVPRAIFVQTDGKILIGGESINELPGQAILARYNTDGTLDTSFYNGGINTLGGTDGWITDIAVHTNGKIYLAITGNSGFDFKVVRLTDRGFADNFGSGGVRTYSGTNAWASAITLTADGGFYLAGNNKVGKFDANGNPVFGFGSSGIATVDFGAPNENVVGIEELPDGRIVVGYYLHNGDNTTDFGAARLNTDGSLDASFSGDGLATVDFAGLDDYATSMALQNDGKIILAGFTEISDTEEDWAIARLDLDGNLDSSFDDDGLYTQSTRIGADRIFDIAVVGPKLIALGGWAGNMRVASYELPGVTVSTQRNIFVVDQEELTVSLSDTAFTEGDPVGVATMTITRNNTNIDEALVVTPVTGINGQIVDGFLILPESVTIAAGESSVTFEIGVADDIYVNGTREFQVAATAPNYLPNIIMASVADDDLGPFGQDNFLVATDAPGEIHEYMGDLLVRIFQIPTLETEFKELRDLAVDADGNLHFWEETFDSSGIRYELTTINPLTGSIVRHSLLPGWSTDSNVTYGGVATLNDWVFVTDMATSGGSQTGIIRYDRSTGTSVRFAESGSPALEFIDLTVGFDGLLYGLDISELVHVYDPATLVELRTINITQSVFPDNRAIAVNEAGDIFAAAWGDGLIRRFDGETGALLSTTTTSFGSLVDLDLRADGTLIASTRFNGIVVTDETLASVSNLSLDGDPSSPFVAFAATPPVVNLRPFANSSSFTTDEDAPHAGTLSGSDPESASLTYVRVDGPAHGTLDFNADGTFTYTPAANYFGTDTFTFTVSDGNSTSMPATVSISVIGVNDAPTFDASSYDFSVAENSANNSAVGTVTASDVDNQPLNYSIIGGNDSGAFAIDAATGAITVADASKLDFETTQSFSLTVRVTDAMLADETTVVVVSLTDIVAPQVAVVEFGYGEDMWATAESLANRTAPWQITQIRIRFTQDVTVDINDLIVTGAAGNYEISEFVYNPTTFTAIWTLSSPIEQDRVTITLDGDSAAAGSDGNEGVHTDGEYLSDGDLLEALDILLGDADGDGRVDFNDMFATYQGIGQPYDPNKDLNGDGRVDFNDMFFAYRQIGRSLS